MKITFLVSSMGSGGAERVAATLCNAWALRGDEVTLVPTFSGGGSPFYQFDHGINLIYLSTRVGIPHGAGKRYLARLKVLRQIVKETRPDVVVSFLPNVNIAALGATVFSGVPCIVCERSDPSIRPIGWVWKIACQLFYRYAGYVTVQTEAVQTSIHRVYSGLKRVAVLPNPLPVEVLGWQAKHLEKDRTSRKILLSLGRLSREKQVDQIISAFSLLAKKFPEWDLHIYGDGPLRSSLIQQVKDSGLIGRVRLMGNTSSPWEVMAAADLFVMASLYEGFPNALLEAMGVGLACVSTDCRSGPREISENGRVASLVPSGIHSALVEALAQLMGNDAERESLGRQARESVIRRYSLSSVLQAWDAVFDEIGVRR